MNFVSVVGRLAVFVVFLIAVVCGYFYQAQAGLGTPPPLHLGCCSGFDIEGTGRPVVVPIPQTSVAGTLNLGEELFPDSERQMRDRDRQERNRL